MFDRLVVQALPLVPKAIVHRVAARYVAGATVDDALRVIRELATEGALATVDLLGEDISAIGQADAAVEAYLEVLKKTHELQQGDTTVSLKLTALGLKLDESRCVQNLEHIVEFARRLGTFVRIDMEDHTCTDATLRIFRQLRPRYSNLGVVLQALLHRTLSDIDALRPLGCNVRLCKGIYLEPPDIAYQRAREIRESFSRCLEKLLEAGCHVAIATHDEQLVRASLSTIQRIDVQRERYEFQLLLGVKPALRRKLIAQGHRVRVYVPYGADWYAYSMRRLRENPSVVRRLLSAMVSPR